MNIENIKNKIKTVCEENPSLNVHPDEFEIKETTCNVCTHSRNHDLYVNAIKIYNLKDHYCYFLTCNMDETDTAAKLFYGYLNEKAFFIRKKQKETEEENYKKKHPILGFFRY